MPNINTVLMVDDNEGDHIIAKIALETFDSSITMHSAYDGQEALEVIDTLPSPPDVILLDINMPGMDGHEFLEAYGQKENNASVVMMLTSSDQESDKEKCFAYPFVKEYVIKPLDVHHLEMMTQYI